MDGHGPKNAKTTVVFYLRFLRQQDFFRTLFGEIKDYIVYADAGKILFCKNKYFTKLYQKNFLSFIKVNILNAVKLFITFSAN